MKERKGPCPNFCANAAAAVSGYSSDHNLTHSALDWSVEKTFSVPIFFFSFTFAFTHQIPFYGHGLINESTMVENTLMLNYFCSLRDLKYRPLILKAAAATSVDTLRKVFAWWSSFG